MIIYSQKKLQCFISSSSEDIEIAEKIKYFLESEEIQTIIWKDAFYSGMTIVENIRNTISNVDFVILIIPTFYNLQSPKTRENIFFEMGIITGIGKPLLTLVSEDATMHLPIDLSSIMYLKYDPRKIDLIFRNIRNWANHQIQQKY